MLGAAHLVPLNQRLKGTQGSKHPYPSHARSSARKVPRRHRGSISSKVDDGWRFSVATEALNASDAALAGGCLTELSGSQKRLRNLGRNAIQTDRRIHRQYYQRMKARTTVERLERLFEFGAYIGNCGFALNSSANRLQTHTGTRVNL
eukprot:scaffold26568_cov30-Tisochrysis_lutea.AAC.2